MAVRPASPPPPKHGAAPPVFKRCGTHRARPDRDRRASATRFTLEDSPDAIVVQGHPEESRWVADAPAVGVGDLGEGPFADYSNSTRISTRGNPSKTEDVSATYENPACSNSPSVPTYAIVVSALWPRLTRG